VRGAGPVEVGAQGDDDREGSVGIGGDPSEGIEECGSLTIIGARREDFLELIDGEHRSPVICIVGFRPPKPVQRVLAWTNQFQRPSLASGDGSASESRQDSGTQQRRFPAARWPDEGEEAFRDEVADCLGDDSVAAEEELGIRRFEPREPLVRTHVRLARRGDGPLLTAVELGILREDRRLEALELRAWLDAQLVDQHRPRTCEGVERLGLSSRPVESEHQLSPPPFAQRLVGHHPLQVADEGWIRPHRQPGIGK
jgi:hypothetical protein